MYETCIFKLRGFFLLVSLLIRISEQEMQASCLSHLHALRLLSFVLLSWVFFLSRITVQREILRVSALVRSIGQLRELKQGFLLNFYLKRFCEKVVMNIPCHFMTAFRFSGLKGAEAVCIYTYHNCAKHINVAFQAMHSNSSAPDY